MVNYIIQKFLGFRCRKPHTSASFLAASANKPPKSLPYTVHHISKKKISQDALRVIAHLVASGHPAYLVGGSVRDLLLNVQPKDFDVATGARPEIIRKLFSNCRLIGRRFRLAHIYFRDEIIEVSTFRAMTHQHHDERKHAAAGLILRDNAYGGIGEDAWRRDFTINALLYDPENNVVLDHVRGFDDLQGKTLRLIGEPETRYREDPVRMLRAVRFAAKLDFCIEKKTEEPITKLGHLLQHISPSRLYEEVQKIFLSGHATKIYHLLRHYHLLQYLFPATDKSLNTTGYTAIEPFLVAALTNTDERLKSGLPVTPGFLLAVMLYPPLREQVRPLITKMHPNLAWQRAASAVLADNSHALAATRHQLHYVRDIWRLQPLLESNKLKKPLNLLSHLAFRAAYDFLVLRIASGESPALQPVADRWRDLQDNNTTPVSSAKRMSSPSGRRRRTRKKHAFAGREIR